MEGNCFDVQGQLTKLELPFLLNSVYQEGRWELQLETTSPTAVAIAEEWPAEQATQESVQQLEQVQAGHYSAEG